jgi:TRAP-type transport system small permease protein
VKIVDRTLDYLLFLILAAMSVIMATNVGFRFLLNNPLYWADELVQVLMVWLTFLGAAVAIREKTHYAFDYFVRVLSGRVLTIYLTAAKAITILAILLLFFFSSKVTLGIADWIMPAMGYSRALVYGACPVGCLFMLIYEIRDLVKPTPESTIYPVNKQ